MTTPDPPSAPSRRQLIKGLGAATLSVVALPGCDNRPPAAAHDGAPSAASGGAYEPRFFSADEWAFIQAVSARLIPADSLGPGAVDAGVPEYIDRQMSTAWSTGANWYMQGPFVVDAPVTMGYQQQLTPQQIYRIGIEDVGAYVHKAHAKSFVQLLPAEQDAVLHDIEGGRAVLPRVPGPLLFSMLLENVREGFFADPVHGGNRGLVGWKLIGFPGARADFMDWVDRDVKYPLPPVALNGQRG